MINKSGFSYDEDKSHAENAVEFIDAFPDMSDGAKARVLKYARDLDEDDIDDQRKQLRKFAELLYGTNSFTGRYICDAITIVEDDSGQEEEDDMSGAENGLRQLLRSIVDDADSAEFENNRSLTSMSGASATTSDLSFLGNYQGRKRKSGQNNAADDKCKKAVSTKAATHLQHDYHQQNNITALHATITEAASTLAAAMGAGKPIDDAVDEKERAMAKKVRMMKLKNELVQQKLKARQLRLLENEIANKERGIQK